MDTKRACTPLTLHEPAHYRLRLQGRVSADWTDWLENLVVSFTGEGPLTETNVAGTVRDQAALFGLLRFVRDLGVPLIAIEHFQPGPEGEAS